VTVVGPIDTGDVQGFGLAEAMVGDRRFVVAVADDGALRRRGLMNVVDLGDLDGMVFDMGRNADSAFVMRNTLIPLDIAFFTDDGELVDTFEMTPCAEEPCQLYQPAGSYRYAFEVPLGVFDGLASGSMFELIP
jgi:uncharacterized membrane protein (UPF0127 family)